MESLISVKIEPQQMERAVRALESIALTLQMYCFPVRPEVTSKPAPPENLTIRDPDEEWRREQEEELRKSPL